MIVPQGFGTTEDVSLRIEKVIKNDRINRKSHSNFSRGLLLGVQSAGKIGIGFTIDTDFFDNFFDSEGNIFFCTKTL